MIRIVTDSTSDFTLEETKIFNIDMVPLSVVFNEGSFLDRVELDTDTFYSMLETKDYPTTSQPSPSQFYDTYKKYKGTEDEIIYIGISGDLSGTVQSARIGSLEFENKIEIIDSKLAAISTRLLILKAIRLRDEGKSFDDIVSEIKSLQTKTKLIAGFDTLEYLVKGGRLSKVAGAAGSLLKIKPLIGIEEGKLVQIGKTRGTKAMIASIVEKAKDANIDTTQDIIIGYTKDKENALKLKEALETEGFNITEVVEIGAVVGVHAGPGACAIAFVVK